MKRIILYILLALLSLYSYAGELNCKVTVNSDQIQGTNKSVFTTLEKVITEFMNDRQWTEYEYQVEERIDCSLYIIVNSYASNSFGAELQVMSTRPIYNSSYKSPLFGFTDKKFNFTYNEGDPLYFDLNSFSNNLTAVLAYYAYIIIGVDCDSFAPLGGTSCFQKAEQIVNQAQSTNEQGWKAFEDNKNRYALINNYLDEICKPFRQYFYTYHRLGLDEMPISVEKGRTKIISDINVLKDTQKNRPSLIIIGNFVHTKIDELINIYTKAKPDERKSAYETLSYVAPTLNNQLNQIK